MGSLYKRYLKLLDKWPVDKSSPNLGVFIREQVKIAFSKGENSKIDEKNCQLQYESLQRISLNYYGNKYPTNFTKSASGLQPEHFKIVLSKEFQEYTAYKELGYFSRLKNKIRSTIARYRKSPDHSTKTNSTIN